MDYEIMTPVILGAKGVENESEMKPDGGNLERLFPFSGPNSAQIYTNKGIRATHEFQQAKNSTQSIFLQPVEKKGENKKLTELAKNITEKMEICKKEGINKLL